MTKQIQHHKRDTSITLTCHYCGVLFNPWEHAKYNKTATTYCSRSCRSRAILQKVNGKSDVEVTSIPLRIAVTPSPNDEVKIQHLINPNELGNDWRDSGEHWEKVALWLANRRAAEAKRREKDNSAYSIRSSEGRQITLSGFNSKLSVRHGNLVVHSGQVFSTENVQEEILYKGIHGVSSIVWMTNGHSGSLSIDAMNWCAGQNIVIRILTNRGEHLATIFPSSSAPLTLGIPKQENGRVDIKLRRAQYALEPAGLDIPLARLIILRKLLAQKVCLDRHPELPDWERGYSAINTAIQWLSLEKPTPALSTLEGIRLYEARASNGYFMAMKGLALNIDAKAAKNWPTPWRTISERKSPLTRWMLPRNATNPFHAMLNFAYAMLESQTRSALNAIGADLACGVLHEDKDGRDSLVFDVIEKLRGDVDDLLLTFVKTHIFSAGDFNTMNTGQVIVHPILCKVLAEQVRIPQRKADDEARFFRSEVFNLTQQ